MIFSLKLQKNPTLSDSSGNSFYRPVFTNFQKIFLLGLRQDHFSSSIINVLGLSNPDFFLKKSGHFFTQVQQKQPSGISVVARFRDTYQPTSTKYFYTDPQRWSFQ